MGMFTSIKHPLDNRELQIKGGGDSCATLSVGDEVDWSVWKNHPGHGDFLDGVYESYSDRGEDSFVIIKDHKIHAVVDRDEGAYVNLAAKYDLTEFERGWWPEKLWAKKAHDEAVERAKEAKEDADFYAGLLDKTEEEIKDAVARRQHMKFTQALMAPLMRRLNYASLGRRIFTVEPLPEGENSAAG
jgi:hypothetical protein